MPDVALDRRASAIRRFNRFYTRRLGMLQETLLDSGFSLTALRVLYELAHRRQPTAADLASDLSLDPGYLSRLLRSLERRGLLSRHPASDRRRRLLTLTALGKRSFAPVERRAQRQVRTMLAELSTGDQLRLVEAMRRIERLLGGATTAGAPVVLRPHQPGDLGWIVQRHGTIYSAEYGWGPQFEALVAGIAAQFLRRFDPARERAWIAERDGCNIGSVLLVRQSTTVAKLRLLLVEPEARGVGLGHRLVDECTHFARQAGYRRITLWTNSVLLAARQIYLDAGYRLVKSEPHRSFGHDLVGEHWELTL